MSMRKSINNPRNLKNNIRCYRRLKGLSQFQLAMLSGTSREYINGLENGRMSAGPKLRKRLALALGVSESELFPPADEEDEKK